MAQGTFVQALRKEAALSGTFMKGRSLMLNGAVLSIEDSGSRFSKNVTVEGSVRGSRGDLLNRATMFLNCGCKYREFFVSYKKWLLFFLNIFICFRLIYSL